MRLTILLPVSVSLLLGCATTEPLPTYFVLTAAGVSAKPVRPPATVRGYVRRGEVPAYLNRTNLASMNGNEVRYSPTPLGALSLDQTISLGIAWNLNRAGMPAAAIRPAFTVPPHTYEVAVHITHFEGHENGDVLLSGSWQILTAGGGRVAGEMGRHRPAVRAVGHGPPAVAVAPLRTDRLQQTNRCVSRGR